MYRQLVSVPGWQKLLWVAVHENVADGAAQQNIHVDVQGATDPSKGPGAEPSASAGERMAGGSPLHSVPSPIHCASAGGLPLHHQDPGGALP